MRDINTVRVVTFGRASHIILFRENRNIVRKKRQRQTAWFIITPVSTLYTCTRYYAIYTYTYIHLFTRRIVGYRGGALVMRLYYYVFVITSRHRFLAPPEKKRTTTNHTDGALFGEVSSRFDVLFANENGMRLSGVAEPLAIPNIRERIKRPTI